MHLHYINKQLYNHKITKDSHNKHCGSGMVDCSTTFDLTFLWKREER
ncbi:hypothetical protein NC653_008782 [Populus alba x Populus x berolinensis]|uniref:Uncharacterized protein n=1 Tax=Populus alba x Populus x berolinensis TaxID=444605 RepID=A0AAD6R7P2_9ROSI|nr:hypothetical protein NC653_008782 [Populus alba x Populus x berolinensis]